MKKTYEAATLISQGDVVAATESGVGNGPEFKTKALSVGSVGFAL
jgi:hypothetical protein